MAGEDSAGGGGPPPLEAGLRLDAEPWDEVTLRPAPAEERAPSGVPRVVPIATIADFAEEISADLLVDASDSLSLIRPLDAAEPKTDGISLEAIGAVLQTRMTTQKIRIEGIYVDEEATVVDLGHSREEDTEEIDVQVLSKVHPAPGSEEDTTG